MSDRRVVTNHTEGRLKAGGRLDLVAVSTIGRGPEIAPQVDLARVHEARLMVLVSSESAGKEVAEYLAHRGRNEDIVVCPPVCENNGRPWAHEVNPISEQSRDGDHSDKLNFVQQFGILTGPVVLFMDDDIWASPNVISDALLRLRESPVVQLLAEKDNSDIHRIIQKYSGGQQATNISVGSLVVDLNRYGSLFPHIYNMDWLWAFNAYGRNEFEYGRQVRQTPNHEAPLRRIEAQEAGDLIAEGLYAGLQQDLRLDDMLTAKYWEAWKATRGKFLRNGAERVLTSVGTHSADFKKIQKAVRVVESASPDQMADFVRRYFEVDQPAFQEDLSNLRKRVEINGLMSPDDAIGHLGGLQIKIPTSRRYIVGSHRQRRHSADTYQPASSPSNIGQSAYDSAAVRRELASSQTIQQAVAQIITDQLFTHRSQSASAEIEALSQLIVGSMQREATFVSRSRSENKWLSSTVPFEQPWTTALSSLCRTTCLDPRVVEYLDTSERELLNEVMNQIDSITEDKSLHRVVGLLFIERAAINAASNSIERLIKKTRRGLYGRETVGRLGLEHVLSNPESLVNSLTAGDAETPSLVSSLAVITSVRAITNGTRERGPVHRFWAPILETVCLPPRPGCSGMAWTAEQRRGVLQSLSREDVSQAGNRMELTRLRSTDELWSHPENLNWFTKEGALSDKPRTWDTHAVVVNCQPQAKQMYVGPFSLVSNVQVESGVGPRIEVMARVVDAMLGPGVIVSTGANVRRSRIKIGAVVATGARVDNAYVGVGARIFGVVRGSERRPISIGDGAIIAEGAFVTADVGKGSIVTSGAIVRSPVPPGHAVVGDECIPLSSARHPYISPTMGDYGNFNISEVIEHEASNWVPADDVSPYKPSGAPFAIPYGYQGELIDGAPARPSLHVDEMDAVGPTWIGDGVVCVDRNVIMAGAQVGEGARFLRAVINPRTYVGPAATVFSRVQRPVEVGRDCTLGPNSVIAGDVIDGTSIGSGAIYLGSAHHLDDPWQPWDAPANEARRHGPHIGENAVFAGRAIGPVRIGAGSLVEPGAIVENDIPDWHALTKQGDCMPIEKYAKTKSNTMLMQVFHLLNEVGDKPDASRRVLQALGAAPLLGSPDPYQDLSA